MAVNPSPNINPGNPIPNSPFYYPQTWSLDAPQGSFTVGAGLVVNPATGVISSGVYPPGTVTLISSGTGIVTSPVSGITSTGTISLAPVGGGLVPGSYSFASVTVDAYGRVINITSNSANIVQGVNGLFPIQITGSGSFPTVGIALGNAFQAGAVQLRDDCITPSTTLALTANQGYILQSQLNQLTALSGEQYLAGTLNASTGKVVTATTSGNIAGIVAGAVLPVPNSLNLGAQILVSTAGTYTPTNGSTAYTCVAGDTFISDGLTWLFFPTGFRATPATTTTAGIVELATSVETQALNDYTLAVTPGTLGDLNATTTQRGISELATDAETLALTANNVVVTPSNLGALQASPTQRGVVQLSNVLGSGSTTQAPTAALVDSVNSAMIPKALINAKGDLIVGQSDNTAGVLPRGTNGSVLTVDVTKPLGLDWNIPDAPATVPVGCIMWYTSADPDKLPVGWVICDGSAYSKATELSPGVPNPYYDLFEIIGTTFGGTSTTYNVPNLGGMFVRGYDSSGTIDPGRTFGSTQEDAFEQHTHTANPHSHTNAAHNHTLPTISTATVAGSDNGLYKGNQNQGFLPATASTPNITLSSTVNIDSTTVTVNPTPAVAPTPDETRPKNIALLPIIKYTNLY